MPADFRARASQIQDRIAAAAARGGRAAEAVRLVAVAKTATPEGLREAQAAGQSLFAHNRVQALVEHHAVLPGASWHLIGPLQRNKARKAVERAACIETVADPRLGQTLDRLAQELRATPLPVLIQVNLAPEDGRAGVPIADPDDLGALQELCEGLLGLRHLHLQGLMTLAPADADAAALHRHFAATREAAWKLAETGLLPSHPELSMGMSGDFEIAVEEGATLVRLGRSLFPPT